MKRTIEFAFENETDFRVLKSSDRLAMFETPEEREIFEENGVSEDQIMENERGYLRQLTIQLLDDDFFFLDQESRISAIEELRFKYKYYACRFQIEDHLQVLSSDHTACDKILKLENNIVKKLFPKYRIGLDFQKEHLEQYKKGLEEILKEKQTQQQEETNN